MPYSRASALAKAVPLPLTLRAYRRLAAALTPFAALLIRQRLKNNKEDPARTSERRGISGAPPGNRGRWGSGARHAGSLYVPERG